MTIINSNYEEWRNGHPDALFTEFEFNPTKMSASGAFYDLGKLDNISKNIISKMNKDELYDEVYKWASVYDKEFADIISRDVDYTKSILNIEREQKKPRKDFAHYSEIKDKIWYMFPSLWENSNKTPLFQTISDKAAIKEMAQDYFDNFYDEADDKDTWFGKIKDFSEKYGFAREVKEYKENPDNYKGHVGDVSTMLRIVITHESMTPDLYEIMHILGKKEMQNRIEKI